MELGSAQLEVGREVLCSTMNWLDFGLGMLK